MGRAILLSPNASSLRSSLAWLLFHRFHLLVALVFGAFPFVAMGVGSALFGNLFVLSLGGQVAVAVLALLLGHVLVTTARTSTACGPLRLWPGSRAGGAEVRLGTDEFRLAFARSWWARRWNRRAFLGVDTWIAAGLALPTLLVVFYQSSAGALGEAGGLAWTLQRIAAPLLAFVLVRGARLLVDFLITLGSPKHDARSPSLLPRGGRLQSLAARRSPALAARLRAAFRARLARPPFGPGYVWVDRAGALHLHSGHLTAMALSVLTIGIYLLIGAIDFPATHDPRLPTLGAVLLVLTVAAWLLPGLSFLLDRYRVPVVPSLLLLSALLALPFGGDHFFPLVVPSSAAAPLPASASADQAAIDAWFGGGEPVLAVAAEGGGITSAAWTATALSALATGPDGDRFLRSLKLISAVSGGSVGAMFFVDALPPRPLGTGASLDSWAQDVRDRASLTSLASVGWGLAYPDLQRLLFSFPWATFWPGIDRSWALEASWRQRLTGGPGATPTLAGWRRDALAGEKPLVLFNATAVETGARFVLSTLAVEPVEREASFWSLYPSWDLAVPTAVRLSSTFPFVGLAARARSPVGDDASRPVRSQAHFVDGGYADNSGLLTALDLLDRALARRCPDGQPCTAPAPRLVLLRLRPFDPDSPPLDGLESGNAWAMAALSPLETLSSVRTSSQAERNAIELRLFEARWRARGVGIAVIDLPLGGLGPLSWKLTDAERRRIVEEWNRQERDCPAVKRLRGAIAGEDEIFAADGSPEAQGICPRPCATGSPCT